MKTGSQNRVWITWESQRRSVVLAETLGCRLFVLKYEGLIRYPKSLIETWAILAKTKPSVLFVQNPSMILTTLACIYKIFKKIPVVVDRHTTFFLNKTRLTLGERFHVLLHYFTVKCADLTIVTNAFLASLVKKAGGRPFILPDKIPHLVKTGKIPLAGKHNVVLISSFGIDEPLPEVLEAMKMLGDEDVKLYITGNHKKLGKDLLDSAPGNVVFTGFMHEREFINLLYSVDAIMTLTTGDATMLCGCYEAVSAEKPLVTSDKSVLTDYFTEAVFVDNTPEDIARGIKSILSQKEIKEDSMRLLKINLTAAWSKRFSELESKLSKLTIG